MSNVLLDAGETSTLNAMITLILDGYNVIHGVKGLARKADRSLKTARDALISLCQAYKARRGDVGRIYVVFDGDETAWDGPSPERGGVCAIFTPKREEADARILSLIRSDAGRSRFVIVSNDNYIFNNARAHSARVIPVSEFYIQTRAVTPAGPSQADFEDKPTLPSRDARQITEAYRTHLEGTSEKPEQNPRP